MRKIYLKKGREYSLLQGHPWIFSGAIESADPGEEGSLAELYSSDKKRLGIVYYHSLISLAARFLTQEEDAHGYIIRRIQEAFSERKGWFEGLTNAFRVINGEGDGIPGLIIDYYDGTFVLQISTLGIEKLKPVILSALDGPVYEKSKAPARKQEFLEPCEGWVKGRAPDECVIFENGLRFHVSVVKGQKTGFFLDQRENRTRIRPLCKGKKILNTFSYTGGFTLSALMAGAASVTSVDSSKEAIALLEKNILLNELPAQENFVEDVFVFLDNLRNESFDGIILDPPAFIKKRGDLKPGSGAYRELHLKALKALKKGGWLLTCSCSQFMEESLFEKIILQAAKERGMSLRILGTHPMAMDHPTLLAHPEGRYLKSLLLG